MESISILLSLFFFSTLYFFIHPLLTKFHKRPPSPFPTIPFIGHLHLLKPHLHRTLSNLSHQYGPILLLRFGSRPVLVVSSPSAAKECLTKHDIVFANRPQLLAGKYLGYNFTSLTWAPYGDHWRNLRRISSVHLLSSSNIQSLSLIRADEVRFLIQRLYNKSDEIVDMKSELFDFMLNVLMRMIAGKRYFGEKTTDMNETLIFREIVSETFRLGSVTNLADFLPILKWIGSRETEKRLILLRKKRDSFIQNLIEEHRRIKENGNFEGRKKTMIEVMLSLQESDPDYFTDEIIKGLMLVLLSAGADTSIGTVEWAMSFLLNHPHVLKKAVSEINDRVGHERHVEESDLEKLPYLHCVINETMRMCPAAPLSAPHESSADCTVGGFYVPRGTMLLVNLWAIQRDGRIWEDPEVFKPERFEGMKAKGAVRDGFRFMPFGSGRRACPGEGLAMRVVGLLLGSLIQCFEWERVGHELVDMTEGRGLTMPKAQPLLARCRPNQNMLHILSQS